MLIKVLLAIVSGLNYFKVIIHSPLVDPTPDPSPTKGEGSGDSPLPIIVMLHLDDMQNIPYTWFHFIKGFVTKDVPPDEIEWIIQTVNREKRVWSSAIVDLITHRLLDLEVSQKLADVY